jgi:hypothetical protein
MEWKEYYSGVSIESVHKKSNFLVPKFQIRFIKGNWTVIWRESWLHYWPVFIACVYSEFKFPKFLAISTCIYSEFKFPKFLAICQTDTYKRTHAMNTGQ